MSFSPDVMHIFCQSPTSLLAIFLPPLTWITVSAWHCTSASSLITSEQKIGDICARKYQCILYEGRWRLLFTTACAGGEPHKTVWSQIYLAGMQIRMNNCQPHSWDVCHQASTTVSSELRLSSFTKLAWLAWIWININMETSRGARSFIIRVKRLWYEDMKWSCIWG